MDPAHLVALADDLAPADRALVRAVYRDGRSITSVAHLLGLQRRTVQARLGRLVRRTRSTEFCFVVARRHAWPTELRTVAEECLLRASTVRDAARTLGLSVHRVRACRAAVIAMSRAPCDLAQPLPRGRSRSRPATRSPGDAPAPLRLAAEKSHYDAPTDSPGHSRTNPPFAAPVAADHTPRTHAQGDDTWTTLSRRSPFATPTRSRPSFAPLRASA